jgi:hypothetical protein
MDKSNRAIRIAPARHDIVGWGVDLNASRRPGIPLELNQETVLSPRHHFPIKSKQEPGPGVNLTVERDDYTPVIGNSKWPSFVTGPLRRFAFTFSEDTQRHWLLLMLADRINMVEGWFEDLAKGRKPMLLPRMEFRTTDHLRRILKQGPKSRQDKLLLASAAVMAIGLGAAAYWTLKRDDA